MDSRSAWEIIDTGVKPCCNTAGRGGGNPTEEKVQAVSGAGSPNMIATSLIDHARMLIQAGDNEIVFRKEK